MMKQRCLNDRAPNFKYYGAKGVTICDAWLAFESFFADMGEAPADCTLDRKEVDGHYEPTNCRWATAVVQANNKRKRQKKTEASPPPPIDDPPF
jgi:hypothetical protein